MKMAAQIGEPETTPEEAKAKYLKKNYTPDTAAGRLLLALRAGRMSSDQLAARIGSELANARCKAERDGFVLRSEGYTQITPLGREHCPRRAA